MIYLAYKEIIPSVTICPTSKEKTTFQPTPNWELSLSWRALPIIKLIGLVNHYPPQT